MKRVLLLQHTIPHYRVPILNLVAEKTALTVLYSAGEAPAGAAFDARLVKRLWIPRVGRPYRVPLRRLARGFDVVIGSFDVDPITRFQLERRPRSWGLAYWGIGVSADYSSHYDADRASDAFFASVVSAGDACVFYADYPKEKYARLGVPKEKLFVAPNTVTVPAVPADAQKDSILFIGTLYRQKGLGLLLDAYAEAAGVNPAMPPLVLVGDGDERPAVEAQIAQLGLEGRVTLEGAIYDDALLAPYFARAYACVSPGQAGLSVLKAMGCGVPYVTLRDAITGGELFNIQSGVNGLVCDSPRALTEALCDIAADPARFIEMGRAAKRHYEENRRPEQMARGLLNAIEYAAGKR